MTSLPSGEGIFPDMGYIYRQLPWNRVGFLRFSILLNRAPFLTLLALWSPCDP